MKFLTVSVHQKWDRLVTYWLNVVAPLKLKSRKAGVCYMYSTVSRGRWGGGRGSVGENVFRFFGLQSIYRIYSAIRQGCPSPEWVQIIKSVLCNFVVIRVLPFLNNPKDLDLSYKMDLDFWDCFGRRKKPSYKRRNAVGGMASGYDLYEVLLYKHMESK